MIKLKPEPLCPECSEKMILKKPKLGDTWESFWGCRDFPECRGTRNIDPMTGEPEDDYDEVILWDDDEDYRR